MLSRIRKRLWPCVLLAAAGVPAGAQAQTTPDTLVLPALVLPVPAAPLRPLPLEGLPTSSRGARGASWSVDERELTVHALLEKVSQRNPAPAGVTAPEVEAERLTLLEDTRRAFADYYQAYRQLECLDEGLRRMQHCRAVAESRRRSGAAPAQDVFQADVELGRLCERRVGLEKQARVACARLNMLMQLPPESALPPPPPLLPLAGELPPVGSLHEAAVARRPDLQALRQRLAAEQKDLAAARHGDVQAAVASEGSAVGVRLTLPGFANRPANRAAECQARLARLHAELQQLTGQVRFQVEAAFAEVRACEQSAQLLQGAVLQAAGANAAAAESAYAAGRVPFLSWVEAERNWLDMHLRRHEVHAEYHRRRAALARAIADPPPAREVSAPPPRFTEVFHEKIYPAAHLTVPAPR
jgi:outer membrane protein TolC